MALGGGSPASAQSPTPRVIAVTGYGHDQAPTTLAEITLGISGKDKSAKATYEQLAKRTSAVAKVLTTGKVETIKSSNVKLDIQYGRDGKPQPDNYEGYRNIVFQVPADNIGLLDNAIATDVDRVQNIRYLASETDLLAARDRALEAAITDAQAQAKVALDKLGFSIQEVFDIQVNDAITRSPEVDTVSNGKDSDSWSYSRGGLAIEGAEQAVDVKVMLKVRY